MMSVEGPQENATMRTEPNAEDLRDLNGAFFLDVEAMEKEAESLASLIVDPPAGTEPHAAVIRLAESYAGTRSLDYLAILTRTTVRIVGDYTALCAPADDVTAISQRLGAFMFTSRDLATRYRNAQRTP